MTFYHPSLIEKAGADYKRSMAAKQAWLKRIRSLVPKEKNLKLTKKLSRGIEVASNVGKELLGKRGKFLGKVGKISGGVGKGASTALSAGEAYKETVETAEKKASSLRNRAKWLKHVPIVGNKLAKESRTHAAALGRDKKLIGRLNAIAAIKQELF